MVATCRFLQRKHILF